MYCDECGQTIGHGHATWCNKLQPGYKSIEDMFREQLRALEVENDKNLSIMSTLYSHLSLVFHRHLPRNLDSLGKDIEKALAAADPVLRPWWQKEMNKPGNPKCDVCPDDCMKWNGCSHECHSRKGQS